MNCPQLTFTQRRGRLLAILGGELGLPSTFSDIGPTKALQLHPVSRRHTLAAMSASRLQALRPKVNDKRSGKGRFHFTSAAPLSTHSAFGRKDGQLAPSLASDGRSTSVRTLLQERKRQEEEKLKEKEQELVKQTTLQVADKKTEEVSIQTNAEELAERGRYFEVLEKRYARFKSCRLAFFATVVHKPQERTLCRQRSTSRL